MIRLLLVIHLRLVVDFSQVLSVEEKHDDDGDQVERHASENTHYVSFETLVMLLKALDYVVNDPEQVADREEHQDGCKRADLLFEVVVHACVGSLQRSVLQLELPEQYNHAESKQAEEDQKQDRVGKFQTMRKLAPVERFRLDLPRDQHTKGDDSDQV